VLNLADGSHTPRVAQDSFGHVNYTGRVMLALSAIPMSVCLLQFMYTSNTLGQLVISIFDMAADLRYHHPAAPPRHVFCSDAISLLIIRFTPTFCNFSSPCFRNFLVVFVVSVFGFGICFRGLFPSMSQFSNFYETALTLFNAALGNFDLTTFSANTATSYKFVGVALMVMYVLGTDILLINLIIARMTVSSKFILPSTLPATHSLIHAYCFSIRVALVYL